MLVPEEAAGPACEKKAAARRGSAWSHWSGPRERRARAWDTRLVKAHLRGDLAEAAQVALTTAPRGFDRLEVEQVTSPVPLQSFWLDAQVPDLGLELTGAALQEASVSKSVIGGFAWTQGLQTRDRLLWIDGRPSAEMTPEEVAAELRVRPLRLGFVSGA